MIGMPKPSKMSEMNRMPGLIIAVDLLHVVGRHRHDVADALAVVERLALAEQADVKFLARAGFEPLRRSTDSDRLRIRSPTPLARKTPRISSEIVSRVSAAPGLMIASAALPDQDLPLRVEKLRADAEDDDQQEKELVLPEMRKHP